MFGIKRPSDLKCKDQFSQKHVLACGAAFFTANKLIILYWLFERSQTIPNCGEVRSRCEVKMARTINTQKKTRPISSHLDRTNFVNKGFIIWLWGKFCLRDTAGSPARVANHSRRFGSSCLLAELAI